MNTPVAMINILRSPGRDYAWKMANEATKRMNTWSDILDYLDWNVINELQTTDNSTDEIPAEIIIHIREKVRSLLIQKWEMRRRYDICKKAAENAMQEVLKNKEGIEFSDNQAKHGITQFLHQI